MNGVHAVRLRALVEGLLRFDKDFGVADDIGMDHALDRGFLRRRERVLRCLRRGDGDLKKQRDTAEQDQNSRHDRQPQGFHHGYRRRSNRAVPSVAALSHCATYSEIEMYVIAPGHGRRHHPPETSKRRIRRRAHPPAFGMRPKGEMLCRSP